MVDRINKTAVRRSFDQAAPEYAKSSTMQRAVAARLLSLAAPCKPEQILAGGVGSGSELPFLHRLFPAAKLTALDLSLQMLRIARRHSSSCICADMEKLPLNDAAFDLVFSKYAEIPGAGHAPFLSHPEIFTATLRHFFCHTGHFPHG